MKNLIMICVMGMSLVMGACAHRHFGGCKDGTCKMESKDHKDCGCGHKHDDAAKKTEEKK